MNDLTADQRRVVAYLRRDWAKKYRVTNIEQAFRALGLVFTSKARLSVGEHLQYLVRKHPSFSHRLRKWKPSTFILTNDEKLIARCLLLGGAGVHNFSTIRQIAKVLALDESTVGTALDTLRYFDFVRRVNRTGCFRYWLSTTHADLTRGLGLSFHEVTRPDGRSFNVECAIDALLLAGGARNGVASVDASCFHCVERIHIDMLNREVIIQRPRGVRLYAGPG